MDTEDGGGRMMEGTLKRGDSNGMGEEERREERDHRWTKGLLLTRRRYSHCCNHWQYHQR